MKRYNTRIRIKGTNKQMRRAHYVWDLHHPDDPILPGEIIHHDDDNKKNDAPENLKKMTDFEHKRLHSQAGVSALAKWRRENPEKAKKQSQDNIKKCHAKRRTRLCQNYL